MAQGGEHKTMGTSCWIKYDDRLFCCCQYTNVQERQEAVDKAMGGGLGTWWEWVQCRKVNDR